MQHTMKTNRKSTGLVTLDIAKAFDTVWHDGVIAKLNRAGCPCYLTKLIQAWLTDRKFHVAIGSEKSGEHNIPAGVPQGSAISPLIYAIYTSDLPKPVGCEIAVYADDTAIIAHGKQGRGIATKLNNAYKQIDTYLNRWRIKTNASKTEAIFIPFDGKKRRLPQEPLILGDIEVPFSTVIRYLGVFIDSKLIFKHHIDVARLKAIAAFRAIYGLLAKSSRLPTKNKRQLYTAIIRPIMMWGCEVWRTAATTNRKKLQIVQSGCLKTIYKLPHRYPTRQLHDLTNIQIIDEHIHQQNTKMRERCALSEEEIIRNIIDS